MSRFLYNLSVYDPEEQRNYNLNLNSYRDYIKAQTDEEFLTHLLLNAKNNSEEIGGNTGTQISTDDDAEINEISQQSPRSMDSSMEDSSQNVVPSCSSNANLNKKSTVVLWEYQQTKELIKSMSTHIGDLNNVKKRKFVFENVANDLLSCGYSVTAIAVQNKWKSLVRSYQKCKDAKTRTGQSPSRFFFFEEMDEILGSKPTNECNHSINSTFSSQNDKQNENTENNSPNITENEVTETVIKQDKEAKPSNKKYKTIKMQYMQKKIKDYDERKERHNEKMELEKKRLDMEAKKIKLLEAIINQTTMPQVE